MCNVRGGGALKQLSALCMPYRFQLEVNVTGARVVLHSQQSRNVLNVME